MTSKNYLFNFDVNSKIFLHETFLLHQTYNCLHFLDPYFEISVPELEQVLFNFVWVLVSDTLPIVHTHLIAIVIEGNDGVALAGPICKDGRIRIHVGPQPMREYYNLLLVCPVARPLHAAFQLLQVGAHFLHRHVDLMNVGHDELEDGIRDPSCLRVHMENLVQHFVVLSFGDPLDSPSPAERWVEKTELQLVACMVDILIPVAHQ